MTEERASVTRTTYLARIAERVINRPLLLHPMKAEILLWVLGERIGVDASAFVPRPEANRFVGQPKGIATEYGVIEFYREQNGVGIVPIVGSLVNRGAWIGEDSSGMTSYEGISFQLDRAMADPNVTNGLALDIGSPGGEASGMFDLATKIREIAKQMPVVAVINDMAASAAYGLASAATEIVVSPTSILGSIGVVLAHFDYSAQLEKKGIKPTLIFAGARKIDGNPYQPLTDAVAADLRDEVNAFYSRFLDTVAAGRGDRLNALMARATEAGIFLGQHDNPAKDAVKSGLADRVGTLADVIISLSTARTRAFSGATMERKQGQPAAEDMGITQVQLDAAVTAARAEGTTAGREQAHARLAAILADDKVKGREITALRLAIESPDMTAEKVAAFVASLPAAAAATPKIAERMGKAGAALTLGPATEAAEASPSRDRVTARINQRRGFKAA